MKPLTKHQLLAAAAGSILTLGLGAGALTYAQTSTLPSNIGSSTPMMHMPGAAGTVTAVSGNTITITGKDGKTYTVDASNAKITKDETVTVSSIAIGDTIMADGTLSGTQVNATNIHDGQMPPMGHGLMGHKWGQKPPQDPTTSQNSTSTQ